MLEMTASTEAQVARLDERLNSIERSVASILDELKGASEGRRRGYEASERVEREIIGITHRLVAVEKSVEAIRPTTVELERVRAPCGIAAPLRGLAPARRGRAEFGIGQADLPRLLPGPALLVLAIAIPLGRLPDTLGRAKSVWISYALDLPTGAAIVCALGVALLLTMIAARCRGPVLR